MIGTSLGPYKIIEQLGAGGMGEVYLGEDTRLGRKVAIKVLPAQFAGDPERLARFEQEARAAAALNHPHIAVVHDIGFEPGAGEGAAAEATTDPNMAAGGAAAAAGVHFIVQEYLEGDTLREPLKKGALPLKKALDLATEIAEALAAAHAAGIIHRDLKPENIFITEEGHAKVLDFGLAKLTELPVIASPGTEASKSPTLLGTVAGQVMGTAGYMAPEQVEGGSEVDRRADLFAFGSVLYEMVTGRQAFSGRSIAETLSRIQHDEPPPIAQADESLPAEIQRIVKKCLAKEAARRYQHADDLIVDVQELESEIESGTARPLSGDAPVAPVAVETDGGISWKLGVPIGLAIAVVAALAGWLLARPSPPEPQPLMRFEIELPPDTNFDRRNNRVVAISPDGTRIAFNTTDGLWMRRIEDLEASFVRGTEGARTPFFSPDSQQLGFWAGGQIKRVAVTGGAAVSLGPVGAATFGASWEEDGNIYFGQGTGGISRVSENGGEPEIVAAMQDGELAHGPQLLPGGEWILFTLLSGGGQWNDASIVVHSLTTGDRKELVPGGTEGRYVPSGHIVYFHDGTLFAVPFDVNNVEVGSGPVSIVQNVWKFNNATGAANYGFSQRGGLVYVPGAGAAFGAEYTPVWVDREGNATPASEHHRSFAAPRLSPSRDRVAFEIAEVNGLQVWILELDDDTLSPLTTETEGSFRYPIWSPDGATVTFSAAAPLGLYSKASGFVGDRPQEIIASEYSTFASAWSPDGKFLVYREVTPRGDRDIWYVPIDDDGNPGEPVAFLNTEFVENHPTLSADGKWLAYSSNVGGTVEVYVRPFPDPGRRVQISSGGGGEPLFSPNGNEIFYRSASRMMVADVQTEPRFEVLDRRELFEGPYVTSPARRNFEYDPETDRFLMLSPIGDVSQGGQATPRIYVVLNWFEELERRVPTGGSR